MNLSLDDFLFYGGIVLMAGTVLLGIVSAFAFHKAKKFMDLQQTATGDTTYLRRAKRTTALVLSIVFLAGGGAVFVESAQMGYLENLYVLNSLGVHISGDSQNTVKNPAKSDEEPPVIEGVAELTVAAGDSVSYKKGVKVSDNQDENVTLRVNSSKVDLEVPGEYPVVYIAEDAAGNIAEDAAIIHVTEPSAETASEQVVNRKADEVLAKITTPQMSQYEVAKAIFNWVHSNVAWLDGSPKTNWVEGAYHGLFEHRGDCYVYASTSKCLLTRAGIKNMDIGFSKPERTHYWNLIDLGEGWYHFDTTRRADGRSFFYCSDEKIRAYSASHNGSHAYDPAQYPVIQ